MERIAWSRQWSVLVVMVPLLAQAYAQSTACQNPKIFSALQQNVENGSESFCQQFIASLSYIGTLRQDPTYFFYETKTNRKSTETVYEFRSTTTKEVVTSTYYGTQNRKPKTFTRPLPSYIQQYQPSKVSQACSCLIGPGPTYTQYRNCEQATTTTTYSTTFTYTVGKPGAKTITYTDTSTQTKLKYTTAPYPSTCPDADNIDYVASDLSQWERGCKTGINCYRDLGTIKAPSFTACIEKCVEYNTKLGYKQCQAVTWDPRNNDCFRINEPCYFAHPAGKLNAATMRFAEPEPTPTDYCATVPGAAHGLI